MPQPPRHQPTARRIRNFAKKMRHEPTDAEAAMWRLLRDRRLSLFKFRRQVPFQSYILDFVCFGKRFIIEIDGSQHASSKRDQAREAVLIAEGFQIARHWNNNVLQQPNSVFEDILARLVRRKIPLTRRRTSSAPPSPTREEGRKTARACPIP